MNPTILNTIQQSYASSAATFYDDNGNVVAAAADLEEVEDEEEEEEDDGEEFSNHPAGVHQQQSPPNPNYVVFFDPFHTSKKQQVFMTFDFETHSSNDWFAVGVVVAQYPSGRIMHEWKTSIPIPLEYFEAKNKEFWAELPDIKHELDCQNHGIQDSVEQKKQSLCEFIRLMHQKYPRIRPISDNPSLDVRLLDTMLGEYNLPPISIRENGSSAPVLCTYSYGLGILGTSFGQSKDSINDMHKYIFAPFKPIQACRVVDMVAMGPKHIPINDCCHTLSMHFKALDVVRFYREYKLRPQFMLEEDFYSQFPDILPQHVVLTDDDANNNNNYNNNVL